MSRETVLVAGGLGLVGRWVTDRLADRYRVVCVDRVHPSGSLPDGATARRADLTDQGAAWEAILDVDPDAVVHLAVSDENEVGTYARDAALNFNVLWGAGRADARVVWTSSETVYGTHWADRWTPDYLPVDEDHPTAPWNEYETAKVAGEGVADAVANRFGVQVATVRPSWVQEPGAYQCAYGSGLGEDPSPSGNLWSYVDVRDLAALIEAALETDFGGHERFNAFAAENYLGVDTADAVEAAWGSLPEECDLSGEESGFSTERARDLLGWEPAHDWRSAAEADVDGPSFGPAR
jgi:nucleoside-diphosphate-sugar epimerase